MTPSASLSDRLSRELPELLELRRHLHAHPELSGEEHQTAALVAGELRQLGWRVREAVGRTGVLAELGGTSPILARMSGSGATCFALYESVAARDAAASQIGKLHTGWWQMKGLLR